MVMNSLQILVVEDELTSRKILASFLKPLGQCDTATDGLEAVALVRQSLEAGTPYSLICLDIKLPGMDGHAVLKEIRRMESERGIQPGDGAKVIMTTVMDDPKSIMGAFKNQCEAYLLKPIEKSKLMEKIGQLGLSGNSGRP